MDSNFKYIKSFTFLTKLPKDKEDEIVDVFIELAKDDSKYLVEIAIPKFLFDQIERDKINFVKLTFPIIFVREPKPEIIAEALERYTSEEEDAFWLKFYYLSLDIKLNSLIKDMNYYVTLKGINIGAFF